MELSLHRWPYAGRAFRRASAPPLLGGLLTFSLALMTVGVVVYAGAVPSLAEQSPLVRQWAAADRARALGPDAPLMGAHGLSGTGGDPSGVGGANGPGQRAPHRTVRLRQLMRARCPTLRIFCCWEGGARRCSAVPASLLRRIGARALSADPRTRHASRCRRPRVTRILQARTRPALVPRAEDPALLRGIPRAAVRPPVNLRVAARLQVAPRAATLLRRHRATQSPILSRPSPLRREARFPRIWSSAYAIPCAASTTCSRQRPRRCTNAPMTTSAFA